jgi:hypothetical protein
MRHAACGRGHAAEGMPHAACLMQRVSAHAWHNRSAYSESRNREILAARTR